MSQNLEERCLNCQAELKESFCSQCGQKHLGAGFEFKEIIAQFASSTFNLEAPITRTVIALIRRPGIFCREYIGGQRKDFYKPIPFLILVVALHMLLRYLFDYDPIEATIQTTGGGQRRMAPAQHEASYWMARNVNYILPFWVLIISFLDGIFFKRQFNYAERVVIFLFFVGEYVLLSLVSIPLTKISPYLMFTLYPIMVIYLTYAISDVHGNGYWNVMKAFLLVLLSFITYVVLANIVLITYFSRFPSETLP